MTDLARYGRLKATDCCGIKEYVGINLKGWTPEWFFRVLMNDKQWKYPYRGEMECSGHAAYIMNAAWLTGKGNQRGVKAVKMMEEYVKEHGLGVLTLCEPAPSGLYGGNHTIQTLHFAPNREVLVPYARKVGWLTTKWDKGRGADPYYGACMWGKDAKIDGQD